MDKKEYMSGSELRQYLHISTRKMKYLMDHDYIPHENTGQATHKYHVRVEDAEAFKHKMETQVGFLAELTGLFSNRKDHHPKPLLEVTDENREAFHTWLEKEWAELPDAVPAIETAKLLGMRPARLYELIKDGVLHGGYVKNICYCSKYEIINYAASEEKLSHPTGTEYQNLIRAFKKRQCRERENEKRRTRRNEQR
ncbi:MAG: hypothetical protein IJ766_05960 [Clostridia bacterium]|nr:hypothetical protein [Clostridia bacterium]